MGHRRINGYHQIELSYQCGGIGKILHQHGQINQVKRLPELFFSYLQ